MWKCENCGLELPIDPIGPVFCKCQLKVTNIPLEFNGVKIDGEPSLIAKFLNFSKASIGHFLKGNPTCTQEEIDSRLAICRSNECGFFKTKNNGETGICKHKSCGCNLKSVKQYLNKLAWADQSCPIGKWGPISK